MKTHRHRSSQRQATQAGSTLIEVLVAALILSIGIMALIGVQASSVQMNKLAQFRGDASRLAQDYADRVRANTITDPTDPQRDVVLGIYASAPVYTGNVAAQNVPTACLGVANCGADAIATMDVAEMREQARLLLPNGAFYVEAPIGIGVGTARVLNIWVMWQAASTRSDDTGTLTGTACPAGSVAASAKNTQCLLTRIVL